MAQEDAKRWDQRYEEDTRYNRFLKARDLLVDHADLLPACGLALDAAMGLGGNAAFLLARGMQVVGVDISGVAVRRAKEDHPNLMAVQADLTRFHLPTEHFDVILNFFYLQRDIWPDYARALRPGGFLVFETMTREMTTLRPDIDPAFLLGPGELQRAFPTLRTVIYREGWETGRSGHPRAVASLIAQKPGRTKK